MLTSSFTLVDTMMVSRLGDVALSSVGMAGQWTFFSSLPIFGICSGASLFVSQFWGVRDKKNIHRTEGLALMAGFLISFLFFAVGCFAPEWVIHLFNKDPQVIETGSRYLHIASISYPATALSLIMSTVLRNTERVKPPLYVSMVTVLINALINYTLIFGKFGFPQMGVEGAAIGTCISAWLGPVLLFLLSLKEHNLLIAPLDELMDLDLPFMVHYLKKSTPSILNETMWGFGVMVLNIIYSNLGYEYYGGVTVYKTINDVIFSFFVGLGNACVVMVGQTVGQGKIKEAIREATRFNILIPLLSLLIGGIAILFRSPLVAIFAAGDTLSQTTLDTAYFCIIFCFLELCLRNIPYIQIVGVFRSGGDTISGMLIDMATLWVCSIPLAYLAAFRWHLPFTAVMVIAYLVEDIPKSILCFRHFFSLRWLKPVTQEGKDGLEEYKKGRA